MEWPNKKILAVSLLSIIAIGISLYVNNKKHDTVAVLSTLNKEEVKNNLDFDSDGLFDWEETLWKTDSQKSDTDNDGTSDGDEVSANRNPLKKGPNDTLEKVSTTTPNYINNLLKGEGDSPETTQTITEQFANQALTNYLYLKQSGQYNNQNLSDAARDLAQNTEFQDIPDTYTIANILYDTKSDYKLYGNNLVFVLGHEYYKTEDPIKFYEEGVMQKQINAEDNLLTASKKYEVMSKSLMNISVPRDLVDLHLALSNNTYKMSIGIKEMSYFKTDPLRGLLGLRVYTKYVLEQLKTMRSLKDYFSKNGIIFNNNESGYFWMTAKI